MADRRQTPDILGEILDQVDAVQVPATEPVAARPRPARKPRAVPKPAVRMDDQPAAQPPAGEMPRPIGRWEYLLVSFQEHNGWRPRFVNGQELEDWTAMPIIHDYANLLGEVGWELAGAAAGALYGLTDAKQLCFKRAKPA